MLAKSIAVVLATSVVAVSATNSLFARSLFARQFDNPTAIPPTCQPACTPIMETISTCQDLDCLCVDSVAAQIAACANCLIGVGDNAAANQQIIDQYTNACITSGASITSIQVSSVAPTISSTSSTSSSDADSNSTPTTPAPGSPAQTTTTAADLNPTETDGAGQGNGASAVGKGVGVQMGVGVALGVVLLAVV